MQGQKEVEGMVGKGQGREKWTGGEGIRLRKGEGLGVAACYIQIPSSGLICQEENCTNDIAGAYLS